MVRRKKSDLDEELRMSMAEAVRAHLLRETEFIQIPESDPDYVWVTDSWNKAYDNLAGLICREKQSVADDIFSSI